MSQALSSGAQSLAAASRFPSRRRLDARGRPARHRSIRGHRRLTASALLIAALGCSLGSGSSDDPARIPAKGPYQPVAAALTAMIRHEMAAKRIPAVSIALVDGPRTVWAEGFGTAGAPADSAATATTVYRIGSVSKLFTDIGIMQLVERGQLDLDAPIATYLPNFHPANPFGGEITLRHLMSHRAGLTREPPVGNYFDPSDSTLSHMVESLSRTTLFYPPGQRTKYSNAGVGTVGYVLEKVTGRPFASYLAEAVLEPMGLRSSAFEMNDGLRPRLASATMWTYDEREFPAPTFGLGMAPAGSMYSTVHDLARFAQTIFAGARAPTAGCSRRRPSRRCGSPSSSPPAPYPASASASSWTGTTPPSSSRTTGPSTGSPPISWPCPTSSSRWRWSAPRTRSTP